MADETPGIEPGEVVGHVEPDTGQGESATSEIPEGVDALSDEQIQAAEERGGGDGEGGDGGALDVSDIVAGDGEDAEGAEGAAADDAGEDAPEMTDPDAQVAPDTGEAT
jgi:hypothetical protein